MNPEYKPGTRVIAISHTDEETIYIFGYGVYEGNFLPPYINIEEELNLYKIEYTDAKKLDPLLPEEFDEVEFRRAVKDNLSNPRIKLDNGKMIWGYECWWSPLEDVNMETVDKKVVEIDIDAERRKLVN